jgi:hypothetical protein
VKRQCFHRQIAAKEAGGVTLDASHSVTDQENDIFCECRPRCNNSRNLSALSNFNLSLSDTIRVRHFKTFTEPRKRAI